MEQLQDGDGNLRVLAALPHLAGHQELLWLKPLLEVVYQLLPCTLLSQTSALGLDILMGWKLHLLILVR